MEYPSFIGTRTYTTWSLARCGDAAGVRGGEEEWRRCSEWMRKLFSEVDMEVGVVERNVRTDQTMLCRK
jgi:hypothetical protein